MGLLALIRDNDDVADFLCSPGEFDTTWRDHVEEVRLASGEALHGLAKDGAGGTYFFCGEGGDERPVLYADSEGGAALLAVGLPELLRLLIGAPHWRDCLYGSLEQTLARDDDEALEDLLEYHPDFYADQAATAAALGLPVLDRTELLTRLHEVATGRGREYVLLNAEEGTAYRFLWAPR
ncbi:hypothetical protein ACFC1R_11090 [Kitasatospora sp. NPDC056138]|uniref:hypothetical protein n=1 Tax=Kitasatospora sp. NPDC056138 TaxID=3345724 RepID=UPI0035DAEBA6